MNIHEKWTTQLKYNISGAADVMRPTIDPIDRSAFYVSDGWQTPYAATRFRKLSLESGEELANILTRATTRCIYADGESIFTVMAKKILQLDRNTLQLKCAYKQNIPSNMNSISSDDVGNLLLLHHYKGTLYKFHLATAKSTRKKVGNGDDCGGIERIDADSFLLFTSDGFLQYSSKTNALRKLADTEHYTQYALGNSGKIYILCREPEKAIDAEGKMTPCSSRILAYSSITDNHFEEIVPGMIFHYFCLSEDENLLYLFRNNTLWIYSLPENQIVFHHVFEDSVIMNVFADHSIVITYKMSCYQLTCWQIQDK